MAKGKILTILLTFLALGSTYADPQQPPKSREQAAVDNWNARVAASREAWQRAHVRKIAGSYEKIDDWPTISGKVVGPLGENGVVIETEIIEKVFSGWDGPELTGRQRGGAYSSRPPIAIYDDVKKKGPKAVLLNHPQAKSLSKGQAVSCSAKIVGKCDSSEGAMVVYDFGTPWEPPK